MLLQQAIAAHHLPVGALPVLGHAIGIVQCRRSVDAQADGKMLGGKKTAPLLRQQNAVRLDAVDDAPALRQMFSLKLHDPAKKVRAENRRFAAVPGEIDFRLQSDPDLLDDIILQQVVGHPRRLGLRVQPLFLQVVAVAAIQVAERPCRLCEDLKFPGCL